MPNRRSFARLLATLAFAVAGTVATASPPLVVGYDRFVGKDAIRSGRVLLTELSCTACHSTAQQWLVPKRGPELRSAGVRMNRDWVRRYLAMPQKLKAGTTMPDMFTDWETIDKRAAIDALVAFLTTQQASYPELNSTASNPVAREFWSKGDPSRGERLYHQVGCVACHAPDSAYRVTRQPKPQFDDETLADLGIASSALPVRSVPHPQLTQKHTRESLTFFLLDPLTIRPAGRMPNLKLDPDEAADIAAYLLADQDQQVAQHSPASDVELVATGKRLFREIGCANCHDANGVAKANTAPKLVRLNAGVESSCIGKPRKGLPHYALDDAQRSALEKAIANPAVDHPVQHRMMQLNCYACHQRDGRGGVGPDRRQYFETRKPIDLGDEGRIPPPLDEVGRKLTSGWAKQVFAGKGDVRPYLWTRMPIFGTATDSLPGLFAAADVLAAKADPVHNQDASGAAGRMLFDQGCVQCHPLQGERLPGVVGVDLARIDARVKPEWFHAFLLDPASLKQRTRMPTFFRNGKSSSPTVLDGNVDRQIASLWQYLKEIKRYGMPDKIRQGREHDFELVPKDRPIVLRTFMERAGPHAIAVGFPAQVNLAFDAETVRIAQFWKGRFLDAHGTWFDRFTPPAKPLGNDEIELPSGGVLAVSSSGEAPPYQFGGYRIDPRGVPTFLYKFAGCEVQDRFEPAEAQGFRRYLTVASSTDEVKKLWLRAIVGKELKPISSTEYQNELGLRVSIESGSAGRSLIKTIGGQSTCFIPVEASLGTEIVVRYQW